MPHKVVCWQARFSLSQRSFLFQFDLVCNKWYLVSLSTTIYFCGVMLGGLIFGSLSDRFGRKPFLLVCIYVPIAIWVGIAFANSYILFACLRFLQGVFMQVSTG